MSPRDARVRALVELAKKMPTTESARRDAVSFANFQAALEQRTAARSRFWARRRVRAASAALLAASVGALCWGLLREPEPDALRYTIEPLVSVQSAQPAEPRRLRFSDGSHVTLEGGAEAQVAQIGSRGARVVLARGRAEVAITKRPNARWLLQAGPYSVRVTGTAFRLSWAADTQQVEVDMRHGSVVVTGPMAGGGVALHAGQRLVGSPRARRLVVEDWPRTPEIATARQAVERSPSPPAPELAAPAPAAPQPPAEREGARRAARESARNAHGWEQKVARGEFAGVLAEARAANLGRVLDAAPLTDLVALADAARYARQNTLGRNALLALRERFAHAQEARDAAFFLGRLSSGGAALGWYERYLSEEPAGSYASQALGRSMMLRYERGEQALASALASEYLVRFPSGPYAASARKLGSRARVDAP